MRDDTRSASPVNPCVYFIRAGEAGAIKIGTTRGNPHARLRDLQTGNPEPLVLLAVMPGGPDVERGLHDRFVDSRLTGEWFRPTERLLGFVEGVTAACGAVPADDGRRHDLEQAEHFIAFRQAMRAADAAVELYDIDPCPGTVFDLHRAEGALSDLFDAAESDEHLGAATDAAGREDGSRILAQLRDRIDLAAQRLSERRLCEAQRDGIDPSAWGVSSEVDPYPYDVVESDDAPESGPRMAVQ